MEKQKNVPVLRFPDFNGEWSSTSVKEFAPLQRGFDLPVINIQLGKYPVVFSNGILKYHNVFKVKAPGVVTGRSGTIGKLTYVEEDFWPHNTSLWVTHFHHNIPKYVYYFYEFFDFQRFGTGSGVPTLNRNDVHNQTIFVPTSIEQQKIASFLTAVDDKIHQLSKKKALLEQYKKGVMQQLFSQQLRFKDDEGNAYPDWKERTLGEMGNTFNGLTGKSKENFGSGHPYITYKQIFDSSIIDVSKFEYVDVGQNESQNLVKFGDVFFTTSSETANEIGYTSVLLTEVETVYLNSFCFGYRIHSFESLSPYYAKYLFRSPQFRIDIQKLAQGSTRYNMSKVGLMKLSIVLPAYKEQNKIANFLSALDDKINGVTQHIEQTQQFKKGLLQQMFV